MLFLILSEFFWHVKFSMMACKRAKTFQKNLLLKKEILRMKTFIEHAVQMHIIYNFKLKIHS